jgi:hypothetical protein
MLEVTRLIIRNYGFSAKSFHPKADILTSGSTLVMAANYTGKTSILQGVLAVLDPSANTFVSAEGPGRKLEDYLQTDGSVSVVGLEFAHHGSPFVALMVAAIADGDVRRFFTLMPVSVFGSSVFAEDTCSISFREARHAAQRLRDTDDGTILVETVREWRRALEQRGVLTSTVDAMKRWARREGGIDGLLTGGMTELKLLDTLLEVVLPVEAGLDAGRDIVATVAGMASLPADREHFAEITNLAAKTAGLVEHANVRAAAVDTAQRAVVAAAGVRRYVLDQITEKRAAETELAERRQSAQEERDSEAARLGLIKRDMLNARYEVAHRALEAANAALQEASAKRDAAQLEVEAGRIIEDIRLATLREGEIRELTAALEKEDRGLAPLRLKVNGLAYATGVAGKTLLAGLGESIDVYTIEKDEVESQLASAMAEKGRAAQRRDAAGRGITERTAERARLASRLIPVRDPEVIAADIAAKDEEIQTLEQDAADAAERIAALRADIAAATATKLDLTNRAAAASARAAKHADTGAAILSDQILRDMGASAPNLAIAVLESNVAGLRDDMAQNTLSLRALEAALRSIEENGVSGVDESAAMVVRALRGAGVKSARPFMAWAAEVYPADKLVEIARDPAVACGVYVPDEADAQRATDLQVNVTRPVAIIPGGTASVARTVVPAPAAFYDKDEAARLAETDRDRRAELEARARSLGDAERQHADLLSRCRQWEADMGSAAAARLEADALMADVEALGITAKEATLAGLTVGAADLAHAVKRAGAALAALRAEAVESARMAEISQRIAELEEILAGLESEHTAAAEDLISAEAMVREVDARREAIGESLMAANLRRRAVEVQVNGLPAGEDNGTPPASFEALVAEFESARAALAARETSTTSALRARIEEKTSDSTRLRTRLGRISREVLARATVLAQSDVDAEVHLQDAQRALNSADSTRDAAERACGAADHAAKELRREGGIRRGDLEDPAGTVVQLKADASGSEAALARLAGIVADADRALGTLRAALADLGQDDARLDAAGVIPGAEAVVADARATLTALDTARKASESAKAACERMVADVFSLTEAAKRIGAPIKAQVREGRIGLTDPALAGQLHDTVARMKAYLAQQIETAEGRLAASCGGLAVFATQMVEALRAPERLKLHGKPLMRSKLAQALRGDNLRQAISGKLTDMARAGVADGSATEGALLALTTQFLRSVIITAVNGGAGNEIGAQILRIDGARYEPIGKTTTSGAEITAGSLLLAISIIAQASKGTSALILENPIGKNSNVALWRLLLATAREAGVQIIAFAAPCDPALSSQFDSVAGMVLGDKDGGGRQVVRHFGGEFFEHAA